MLSNFYIYIQQLKRTIVIYCVIFTTVFYMFHFRTKFPCHHKEMLFRSNIAQCDEKRGWGVTNMTRIGNHGQQICPPPNRRARARGCQSQRQVHGAEQLKTTTCIGIHDGCLSFFDCFLACLFRM